MRSAAIWLKAIPQSFYNPDIYRDAILHWKGFGGVYVLVVAFILALIQMGGTIVQLQTFERTHLSYLFDQVPPIVLKDGALSVQAKEPVLIKSKDGAMEILIDTQKSLPEMRMEKAQIVIGKNFVVVKNRDGDQQVLDLRQLNVKSLVITKDWLYRTWQEYTPLIKLLAFPVFWLSNFPNLLVKTAFVALLSYVVTAFMPEEYIFVTRMRLAALALTLPEIISNFVLMILQHPMAFWFSPLLACLIIYVMIVLMRGLTRKQAAHS